MRLRKITIENFRGISTSIGVDINDFNCVVGKNDAGKSTILKALDIFLNDKLPDYNDKNYKSSSNHISIELQFNCEEQEVIIDDAILTTFEAEELVNEKMLLCVKKVWDVSAAKAKVKWYYQRKKYVADDFIQQNEKGLRSLCEKYSIDTQRANGDEFNNKEKRDKLRAHYSANGFEFEYIEEELAMTGQTRSKKIYDEIKSILPSFEYFKADSSLSDSDTAIQKYFKDMALNTLKNDGVDTDELEATIRGKINESLTTITEKINSVLSAGEHVEAQVNFDWSKLISTSFKCKQEESAIPLSSRGDGFRRITMMSYFEMLAEESKKERNIILGFEEPETFLHPETQKLLYQKLVAMQENGYQILVTTHSPNIVAETDKCNIIFVGRDSSNSYKIDQGDNVDIEVIINELGIKADDEIFKYLGMAKCLFLVEGPDDVNAFHHTANMYKGAGKISKTFEDLDIVILPIGGCDSIIHWNNFKLIEKFGKPFFILLDSDKDSESMGSANLTKLQNMGYASDCCSVLKKRMIESYIPKSYFTTLSPPIIIEYSDWDNIKDISKTHPAAIKLGGKKICEYHFKNLSYVQLRSSFCPDDNDANDEFLDIYKKIKCKLPSSRLKAVW